VPRGPVPHESMMEKHEPETSGRTNSTRMEESKVATVAARPVGRIPFGLVLVACVIAWLGIYVTLAVSGSPGGGARLEPALNRSFELLWRSMALALPAGLLFAGFMGMYGLRFLRSLGHAYAACLILVTAVMMWDHVVSPPKLEWARQQRALTAYAGPVEDHFETVMRKLKEGKALTPDDLRYPEGLDTGTPEGRAIAIMSQYGYDLTNSSFQYRKEQTEAGFMTIMDPERISKDTDFRQSHELLEKMRGLMAKWRARQEQLRQELPKRLDDAGVTRELRVLALKGFEKALSESKSDFTELWNSEAEAIQCYGEAIGILESARSRWTAVEGRFVFENDQDLRRFNKVATRLMECSTRQREIQQRRAARIGE